MPTERDNNSRAFRFGVQARTAHSRAEWVHLARRVEELGYSVLTMPDHNDEQLAAIPAIMAAADATTSLRLGQLCLANDFKHPAILAKEYATLDVLSDGRLELGIGAGHAWPEYRQMGIPFDDRKTRVDRFFEGVEVIRGLMAPGPFCFSGDHYQIENYDGLPKPLQSPPPLLIGGGGKRILTFAARNADIVGISNTTGLTRDTPSYISQRDTPPGGAESAATMLPEAVDKKVSIVREAAGPRWNEIELQIRTFMMDITNDVDAGIDRLSKRLHLTERFLRESPFVLVGPPSKLVEDLLERRDRWGFSYISVSTVEMDAFARVVEQLT